MATLSFSEARQSVLETVRGARTRPEVEEVDLLSAAGRVLAQNVSADRDYPPLARSLRDGFAVRCADLPGALRVIGEVRAGEQFGGSVGAGETVEIMTGAPVPNGADAVVMIEHVVRDGGEVRVDSPTDPGQFINPQGCESKAGDVAVPCGKRLDFSDVAMLAAVGRHSVAVYAKPSVALLATGDEIIPVTGTPKPFQIRNSNVYSLAAQVTRAGGVPRILPVARDDYEHTRQLLEQGLASDLLLVSGGVSAGKYDLVEKAFESFGAEFFFDRVLIQPGQPLVFGRARNRFFFGLPGNPASTMVTFEIFARAALELLGGQQEVSLPMSLARLGRDFRHKPGLTRFLPAYLSSGGEVTPVPWNGSSDVPALTRANAFLVADAERAQWSAGELIRVLLK
ncbi:MAG: molybdopterin molybdotransferase MoeA [Acidobacteria bacterium]|nr:molybdopterin molybdotransferase MoeA [Acidobacteriota bacterium]